MGRRLPAKDFIFFEKLYSKSYFTALTITSDKLNMFALNRCKGKTNTQRYGKHVSNIFEWLVENTEEPWYPTFDGTLKNWAKETTLVIYFFSEMDAMGFKLMFS